MNSKKRLIEKIGKRMDMVNESLSPMINFDESEVHSIIHKIYESKLTKEEAYNLLKDKLKEKGRTIDPTRIPPGAMM